ncbi:LOW QUALITY PROTEIN: hypothetical protein BDA96_10G278600 [Sorghum bicolor]|uniref:Uncharacterized protein n=1 Tax=Sorghum bicolor TaxID=4558 RepID=A0A921Q6V9_SORBI|nr:LOW QUALITY PROTEIN: hypothetical protein BDA96_10G278600 [Sorghum bicolor]
MQRWAGGGGPVWVRRLGRSVGPRSGDADVLPEGGGGGGGSGGGASCVEDLRVAGREPGELARALDHLPLHHFLLDAGCRGGGGGGRDSAHGDVEPGADDVNPPPPACDLPDLAGDDVGPAHLGWHPAACHHPPLVPALVVPLKPPLPVLRHDVHPPARHGAGARPPFPHPARHLAPRVRGGVVHGAARRALERPRPPFRHLPAGRRRVVPRHGRATARRGGRPPPGLRVEHLGLAVLPGHHHPPSNLAGRHVPARSPHRRGLLPPVPRGAVHRHARHRLVAAAFLDSADHVDLAAAGEPHHRERPGRGAAAGHRREQQPPPRERVQRLALEAPRHGVKREGEEEGQGEGHRPRGRGPGPRPRGGGREQQRLGRGVGEEHLLLAHGREAHGGGAEWLDSSVEFDAIRFAPLWVWGALSVRLGE